MAKKPVKSSGTNSVISETKLIRELAKILKDTDLSEIEMEKGDLRVRVARTVAPVTIAQIAPAVAAPATASIATATPTPETAPNPADDPNAVKSPMVGTAYIRANPDADPFIKIGESVKEGDTVLLIEAMKTFNPIKAPKSGTVSAILIEDGQAIEFGEALLIIT
ncbi:MAG: acetyl-CoA carboxylase, biotin carboxyl carrier protein [Robiginitomaculum sp.]|nr:MAG: acetyl-CoA carboxylase, biotin carboxyl carrier protein [Robiginitomaculum sp.]